MSTQISSTRYADAAEIAAVTTAKLLHRGEPSEFVQALIVDPKLVSKGAAVTASHRIDDFHSEAHFANAAGRHVGPCFLGLRGVGRIRTLSPNGFSPQQIARLAAYRLLGPDEVTLREIDRIIGPFAGQMAVDLVPDTTARLIVTTMPDRQAAAMDAVIQTVAPMVRLFLGHRSNF